MQRLKQRADFLAAAAGAKASGATAAAAAFVLQARARGDAAPSRVGFTVSKKVGNAVERNRVRRRLREVVRLSAALTAQPAPDPVALDRVADLLRHREAEPRRPGVEALARLQDEGRCGSFHACGRGKEVRPLLQALHRGRASGAEPLAALRAPCGDDFAAAGGGGAGAEAVTALAHQLARLIGPFHGSETPLVLGAEGFG